MTLIPLITLSHSVSDTTISVSSGFGGLFFNNGGTFSGTNTNLTLLSAGIGSITFNTPTTLSLGTGGVTLTNTGTQLRVQFDAPNNYSGATYIGAGSTLELQDMGGLGTSSSITVASGGELALLNNGGTLSSTGTITLNGSGAVGGVFGGNNDGALSVLAQFTPTTFTLNNDIVLGSDSVIGSPFANTNPTLVLNGGISGDFNLTTNTSATTILTGTNSYATTTISSGTLQIGNAGTTGTLGTGTVSDNAALSFNRTDAGLSVSNVITGTGTLTQAGTGTTILTAANDYSGGTTISAGTLQLGDGGATGSITGSIVDNSNLEFDLSNSFTLANTISGSGNVIQAGAGSTITIAGTNSYTGTTSITDGELSINTLLDVGGGNSALGAPTTAVNGTIAISGTGDLQYTGAATSSNRVINLTGSGVQRLMPLAAAP